ncbi:T9SS type A sorting domain-containing protein [Winogradskyella sp. UBA3174]|uniref:T9SS type A sorting domain-containing protein n=1 Tax=Winogradskyella sp. UBA3174 TaxID=1947785 RepID=UPI0039C90760
MYPNPATETINIKSKINTIKRIEIYSITGRLLKSIEDTFTTIDISNFSQGSYFLKVYSADNFIIKQFVKK